MPIKTSHRKTGALMDQLRLIVPGRAQRGQPVSVLSLVPPVGEAQQAPEMMS